MGFKKHNTLKCHTCTRKDAVGGPKKSGSREVYGWKLIKFPKSDSYVMLCPTCNQKRENHEKQKIQNRKGDDAVGGSNVSTAQ